MECVDMSHNQFSGSVPSGIAELQFLEKLILQDNRITGTIPSEIGMLRNLTHVFLAYNKFKGSIPDNMIALEKLEKLHLQSNNIDGDADIFNYRIESYITDCGATTTSNPLVECKSCTLCCNVLFECLSQREAWPSQDGLVSNTGDNASLFVSVVLITLSSFFLFFSIGLSYALKFLNIIMGASFHSWEKFQERSVYRFFLTKDLSATVVAICTLMFHFTVLANFLYGADYRNNDAESAYKHVCPITSLDCNNASQLSVMGLFIFVALLLVFLAPDFASGAMLVYDSIKGNDVAGIVAGSSVLFITAYSFIVSYIFNTAIGVSNIEIMFNAAILLFLNDVDEKLYSLIKIICPKWVDFIELLIHKERVIPEDEEQADSISSDDDNDDVPGGNSKEKICQEFADRSEVNSLRQELQDLKNQFCSLSSVLCQFNPESMLKKEADGFEIPNISTNSDSHPNLPDLSSNNEAGNPGDVHNIENICLDVRKRSSEGIENVGQNTNGEIVQLKHSNELQTKKDDDTERAVD
jgi:hypothetical protein